MACCFVVVAALGIGKAGGAHDEVGTGEVAVELLLGHVFETGTCLEVGGSVEYSNKVGGIVVILDVAENQHVVTDVFDVFGGSGCAAGPYTCFGYEDAFVIVEVEVGFRNVVFISVAIDVVAVIALFDIIDESTALGGIRDVYSEISNAVSLFPVAGVNIGLIA